MSKVRKSPKSAASPALGVATSLDNLTPTNSVCSRKRAVWRMFEVGVTSEQGTRKTMEDQHKTILAKGIPFFGVYDGHGGTQCAEFLRENLHEYVLGHPDVTKNPEKAVKEGILLAEERFMEKCQQDQTEAGSTVAVALFHEDKLVTANVGDSEIILSRGGKAVTLSMKHTPGSSSEEAQRVKEVGGRVWHDRVGHPKFNPSVFSLGVSRAIGDAGFKLEKFTCGIPSGVIAEPTTKVTPLTEVDEFLIIGCDGLWDVIEYEEAIRFCRKLLLEGKSAQDITDKLCQEALRLGSTDNVTCMFINIQKARPQSGDPRPDSAASSTLSLTTR